MGREQREEFERRVLARLRSLLDDMDEDYPHGYEFTDFVITGRYYSAPEPDSRLDPWAGGPFPGWYMEGFTMGSSTSYVVDKELLLDGLAFVQRRLDAHFEDVGAEEEEEEEEEEEDG